MSRRFDFTHYIQSKIYTILKKVRTFLPPFFLWDIATMKFPMWSLARSSPQHITKIPERQADLTRHLRLCQTKRLASQ